MYAVNTGFRPLISLAALAGAVLVAASCDGSRPVDPMAGHNHSSVITPSTVRYDSNLAKDVREAMSRYHSQAEATQAGYALASPCVFNPGVGGMGFHWVNGALVDPTFDPMNPEAVLYNAAGKLVAVEYIVINVGQPAPTFDGHAFDVGGAPIPVPHWTLHVWLWEPNSNGLFNAWNPAVVCPQS